jgi:hypothetical protein
MESAYRYVGQLRWRVTRAFVNKRKSNASLCTIIFLSREWYHQWLIMFHRFCGGNVSDAAVGLRSWTSIPRLRDRRSRRGRMILIQTDLIIRGQACDTTSMALAIEEEMAPHRLAPCAFIFHRRCPPRIGDYLCMTTPHETSQVLSQIAQAHLETVYHGQKWCPGMLAASCILTDPIRVGDGLRGVDIGLASSTERG